MYLLSFILEHKVVYTVLPLPTFSHNNSAMMPDGRDKVTGPSSFSEFLWMGIDLKLGLPVLIL